MPLHADQIILYMDHRSYCTMKQDWSEAQEALSTCPEGPDKDQAYEEMRTKMNTCSCGLATLIRHLHKNIVYNRDLETWNAALTVANNVCVRISNDYNRDDDTEEATAANNCAKEIRGYIDKPF